MSKWSHPQEIKIPISYGYIAAKTWGREQHEPVLALHGYQDNAGTFDLLIPLLSQDLYIVAIDAPGHGLSSHMPPGTFYPHWQILVEIKQVMDYMKWNSVSLIGHSHGGQIAIMFSSIYPDIVKNVVLLDIAAPPSCKIDELAKSTRITVEDMLQLGKKLSNHAVMYSLEDARNRLKAIMYNQVSANGIDILLKRGCLPSISGKGVVFSGDSRLRVSSSAAPLSHDSLKGYLRNVQCNLLIILGNDEPGVFRSRFEKLDDIFDSYKETCRSFKLARVDGNHFVHLNNPDRVAPLIDDFFKEHRNYEMPKI